MRNRLFGCVVAALLTLCCTRASAAPVGAPCYNLDPLSFSVSAVAGFSWRQIRVVHDHGQGEDGFSSRLGVRAAFGPLRFLDVYGMAGVADWRQPEPRFESTLGFQYGGGFRFRVYPWPWEETGLFNVELDGQILTMDVRSGNTSRSAFGADNVTGTYWEYQAALLVSKRFEFLVPFGGLLYDQMGVEFSPGGSNNVENDFRWGAFIGIDYFVTPLVFFSAELHIFTETALFLGAGLTY